MKPKLSSIYFPREMKIECQKYDFKTYLNELNEGIEKLSNLDAYEPTKKIQIDFPGIVSESREIIVKMIYGGLIYLVADKGVAPGKESETFTRCKGYLHAFKSGEKLKEVTDKRKLEKLLKEIGGSFMLGVFE